MSAAALIARTRLGFLMLSEGPWWLVKCKIVEASSTCLTPVGLHLKNKLIVPWKHRESSAREHDAERK